MEKINDKFLYHVASFTPEYAPHVKGSQFFERLEMRMIDVENWEEKVVLDRSVYEDMLKYNNDLAQAYVNLYSKTAQFVVEFIEFEDGLVYEFYSMVDNKEIVMIFFRLAQ